MIYYIKHYELLTTNKGGSLVERDIPLKSYSVFRASCSAVSYRNILRNNSIVYELLMENSSIIEL